MRGRKLRQFAARRQVLLLYRFQLLVLSADHDPIGDRQGQHRPAAAEQGDMHRGHISRQKSNGENTTDNSFLIGSVVAGGLGIAATAITHMQINGILAHRREELKGEQRNIFETAVEQISAANQATDEAHQERDKANELLAECYNEIDEFKEKIAEFEAQSNYGGNVPKP